MFIFGVKSIPEEVNTSYTAVGSVLKKPWDGGKGRIAWRLCIGHLAFLGCLLSVCVEGAYSWVPMSLVQAFSSD